MSHQKLLNSILNQNKIKQNASGNNQKKPETKQPSLKELMNILNMLDPDGKTLPNDFEEVIKSQSTESDNKQRLEKMYIKPMNDPNNINKYLFCQQSGMYLPVGYRYAGYHTSKDNKKTILYTRQNEDGYYVVHCLGKKVEKHNNYDVYLPIDISSQLDNKIMQMVKDGIEIRV